MNDSASLRARAIADEVMDPDRTWPVVGVGIAAGREAPLIDVDALREQLAATASLHVVRTGDESWALKRALPRGLDVYGDAVRVWQAGNVTDQEHPLLLLRPGPRLEEMVQWVLELVGRQRREVAALVESVSEEGALLRLADGRRVAVEASQVSRLEVPVPHLLRVAQPVRVLVREMGSATGTGTLVPFEPDPLERLRRGYGIGSVLLARISGRDASSTELELLPGATARVPSTELTFLTPSDTAVPVTITELSAHDRVGVSVTRERAAQAASVLPDGPPWFLPAVSASRDPFSDVFAERASSDSADPEPRGEVGHHGDEVEDLRLLIERATATRLHLDQRVADINETLRGFRREAAHLREQLELDLMDARERVLTTVDDAHLELATSSVEALADARREIHRLRSTLRESNDARSSLGDELRTARALAEARRVELANVRTADRKHRERIRELQRELDSYVPAETRFIEAVRASWLRNTTKADRELFPWREPTIGPAFLASLDRIEGVPLDRVIDVCAEVACGRAGERAGFQVHALRASAHGGSGQLVRQDGARAFRASLQVRTAAARRLHYWLLPQGGVELAQIGYHDDFRIAH